MHVKADHQLDCRGLVCPTPIIKIARAIAGIRVGEVLEMLSTDPGSRPDVETWTKQTGHELVARHEADGVYTFTSEGRPSLGRVRTMAGAVRRGVP
jgi:tRNA 2-thiouridine synthesizing protein A